MRYKQDDFPLRNETWAQMIERQKKEEKFARRLYRGLFCLTVIPFAAFVIIAAINEALK